MTAALTAALVAGQVAAWRGAIGRRQVERQRLDAESLRRFALAIDADPDVERVQPALAHWAFFLPAVDNAQIGADGHPLRGGFLPAIALPRRMFAAGVSHFDAPLVLGAEAEMTSTIADVSHKSGRSGDLVFVEVDRVLAQDGRVRVRERQSLVYRGDGGVVPAVAATADLGDDWQPTAVQLFRFSAATFNSHRIHYDLPYAQGVEGYPALVVQGPLTASKLAALAAGGGQLARFGFRASAPLFVDQPVRFERDGAIVRAVRCDGVTAMTADGTLA